MRATRYILLLLAIYFVFIGGSSRYLTLYQVRVLHHIVVTGVLGLWLLNRIRRDKGLPSTPLNPPLFALIGVWFISAFTSLDPRMAIEHIWFPFTYIVMFFVIVDYFQRGRGKIIMEVFFFIVVTVILLTALEYASWYFGLGIMPNTEVGWFDVGILIPPTIPPASLAMGFTTLVAGFTVPCLFIVATWALTVQNRAYKRILWVIAGLLLIIVVLTGSTGGLVALLGGISTYVVTQAIQRPRFKHLISLKNTAIAGIATTVVLLLILIIFTFHFITEQSDETRLDMWRSAVEITIDYPVTGVGPGLFGRAFRDYLNPVITDDKFASAHNFYLNLTSELGLIGLVVGGWLAVTVLRTSWHIWRGAKNRGQRHRVEGIFVALVALAVHSTVDVFTVTPINMVLILIVAYLTTGHRSFLDALPIGKMRPAYGMLVILVAFGVALWQWDRAQGLYHITFNLTPDDSLPLIREAQSIDPHLRLYHLHEAYLLGKQATNEAETRTAISAYEDALTLEPTWDVGWINLGYLELQQGNVEVAYEHLQYATEITPRNTAPFLQARIADTYDLEGTETLISTYLLALEYRPFLLGLMPLSQVWWSTPASLSATQQFLDTRDIAYQYRVYRIHRSEIAQAIVPENPKSANDWWVVGQHQLDIGNIAQAKDAFDRAIHLNPVKGDYYVSRARTQLDNPESALRDLELAQLHGTQYEYPNTVRAQLAKTEQEAIDLKATALPIYSVTQEFAGVLFARPAVFDIPQDFRYPGLGESVLIPWYDVAEYHVAQGDIQQAIQAYEFILSQAPYESRALDALDKLKQRQ